MRSEVLSEPEGPENACHHKPPPQCRRYGAPRKAQAVLAYRNHKAGLVGPALLAWNWFSRSWFDRPLQNIEIGLGSAGHRAAGTIRYITSARFSSSCCSTGRAHTLPFPHGQLHPGPLWAKPRSRGPSGEYLKQFGGLVRVDSCPPCSKSLRKAANSVAVNLSLSLLILSFIKLSNMAVITSDSDLPSTIAY